MALDSWFGSGRVRGCACPCGRRRTLIRPGSCARLAWDCQIHDCGVGISCSDAYLTARESGTCCGCPEPRRFSSSCTKQHQLPLSHVLESAKGWGTSLAHVKSIILQGVGSLPRPGAGCLTRTARPCVNSAHGISITLGYVASMLGCVLVWVWWSFAVCHGGLLLGSNHGGAGALSIHSSVR